MGETGFAREAHKLRFCTVSSEARNSAKPVNWRKTGGFSTSKEPEQSLFRLFALRGIYSFSILISTSLGSAKPQAASMPLTIAQGTGQAA